MAWTTVSKPSAQTYSNVNPSGREQYDDPEILFDDPDTYYDGINPNMWTDVSRGPAWNISKAVLFQSKSVAANSSLPESLYFREDGLKAYILGFVSNGEVSEYNLSTAWDISTLSFVATYDVSAQDGSSEAIWFRNDGSLMYMIGGNGDRVYQYQLSTPWDITTANNTATFSIGSKDNTPRGLAFDSYGSNMYFVGSQNDSIYQYSLSSPWDITSGVFVRSFSLASQTNSPDGVFFKPDGMKFYIAPGGSSSKIFEYSMTTPWNISTAVFSNSLTISLSASNVFSLFFKPDGTKVYFGFSSADLIKEYNLTTSWTNIAKPN